MSEIEHIYIATSKESILERVKFAVASNTIPGGFVVTHDNPKHLQIYGDCFEYYLNTVVGASTSGHHPLIIDRRH